MGRQLAAAAAVVPAAFGGQPQDEVIALPNASLDRVPNSPAPKSLEAGRVTAGGAFLYGIYTDDWGF
jgi:hypothetical protein